MSEKVVFLSVDLLKYTDSIDIKDEQGKKMIFDIIRKKYLVLQPEELVRQLLLCYFIGKKIFPKSRIAVERALKLSNEIKRFDIVVFDKQGQPWMLIECKAFNRKIDHNALLQACQYNQILRAPYFIVSNGKQTFCCAVDFINNEVQYLDQIPYSS